jgi:hypothetical protein
MTDAGETAWCTHCQRWKPRDEFSRNLRKRDGLSSWCAACHGEASRAWRERNPEWVRAYAEARRRQPVDRVCSECREHFLGGPNKIVCSSTCAERRRRRLHPERERARQRAKYARRKASASG